MPPYAQNPFCFHILEYETRPKTLVAVYRKKSFVVFQGSCSQEKYLGFILFDPRLRRAEFSQDHTMRLLTYWPLGDVAAILQLQFANTLHGAFAVELLSDKYRNTS